MAMKSKAQEKTVIEIKPIATSEVIITLVGDTPLLVHNWTEKAKRQMLEAEQGKRKDKKAREARQPFHEFVNELYWVTEKPNFDGLTEEEMIEKYEAALANGALFGFPITAIKKATASAVVRGGFTNKKTDIMASFRLDDVNGPVVRDGKPLAVIETTEPPRLQEDMVTVGIGGTDLRYRPAFDSWRMTIRVKLIETGVFTMESIINAINLGGAMVGIGEWRMEKSGENGLYHVATDGE